MGTYFGEDIKISSAEEQTELREPGYEYFKQRNWSQGVIAITEANAKRMARPAIRNPIVLQGATLAVAVLSIVNFIAVSRRVRRFESDAEVFDSVTVNVNERVAGTDFILDEGFGSKIHNASATLLRNYTDALDLRDSIKSTSFFALHALNLPLKKRIDEFSDTTDQIEYGAMHDDGTNTSAYLNQIANIREELTSRMTHIQDDVLARSGKQQRFIRDATEQTLRSNRARSRSLTGYFDMRSFYTPAAFSIGYNRGLRDYQSYKESRNNGGGGGTTTGYGSSGGGFSGAGSSSRF